MKKLIQIEEIAILGFSLLLFSYTEFAWWWFPVLILLPDIGMFGYVFGNKIGAFTYNLTHHRALAIILLSLGWYISNEWIELSGIILLGHSGLDRTFGYGLKYTDSFHHTHLGWLQPKSNQQKHP